MTLAELYAHPEFGPARNAELRRIGALRCEFSNHSGLLDKAITCGWTVEKTREVAEQALGMPKQEANELAKELVRFGRKTGSPQLIHAAGELKSLALCVKDRQMTFVEWISQPKFAMGWSREVRSFRKLIS